MTDRATTGPVLGPFLFLGATTALAGYVEAVGFVTLSGLYVSFMSGNTTRLGVLLSRADWPAAAAAAGVVASFVAGATIGSLLSARMGGRAGPVLAAEACLIALAILLGRVVPGYAALLPVVLAMGMQNVMHKTVAGADTGKTFVTGGLFSLGEALARLLGGKGRAAEPALLFLSWLSFVGGATAGALLLMRLQLAGALIVAFGLIAMLALFATARRL